MMKEFFLRKLIESKLKNVPAAEREKLVTAFTKNPEFFANIAKDVEVRMKSGMSQFDAAMAVMQEREKELKAMIG